MAEKELGALWIKKGAKGQYMTGILTIDGVATPIVCFSNQNKKNPKEPDWRILRSVPKEQKANVVSDTLTADGDVINPDDIPF